MNSLNEQIEWDVAEVLGYDRTYNYISPDTPNTNVSELFALKVRSCKSIFDSSIYLAKPANINLKQIPLIGEFVLIYKTFNQESHKDYIRQQWYYLMPISVQSNINNNPLPGISSKLSADELANFKLGKTYKQTSVSPLQPYEGDILFEGRFGNSIRFGSTVIINSKNNPYSISPTWKETSESDSGNPIIILSNGRKNKRYKEFVLEDIETDASSLYLTSTQKLSNLKLHNVLNQSSDSSNAFVKSQFLGVADRIILKSKTDVVALDSNKSIELNSPLLSIGTKQDKDKEYGLHSTAVKELFDQFFYLLSLGGLKDSNGMPVTIDPTFTDKFFKLRNSLDNVKIRQDKGDE